MLLLLERLPHPRYETSTENTEQKTDLEKNEDPRPHRTNNFVPTEQPKSKLGNSVEEDANLSNQTCECLLVQIV